ncbi:sigma-70 family RNA polymerase sigma factor, partial [bacterium]|nr:sigma-70 family RNA polymerase sigma factor [bacterium]
MFDPRITACLGRAARLLARPGPETADARLLERYARDRDPTAFAELLARHGPAVWALCRRLARTEADAEDAFQATFLVLARLAGRVRSAASLGSWLYGTATRITRRARARAVRVPDPDRLTPPVAPPEPPAEVSWNEVRAALAEEVSRLPDALRAAVLLCYFDGLTQDEAAVALGWTPRAVKARVARARDRLRARLTRRGIDLSAALAVPLLTTDLRAAPPHLCAALLAAAVPGRRDPPGDGLSPAAVSLARTEAPVPLLRPAALLATAAAVFAAGALAGQPARPPGNAPAALPAAAAEPKLPPGGVRIGTTEFRQTGWHSRVFFADGGRTLVTAGEGVVVRYWDLERGRVAHELELKGSYQDAAATPDGTLLAVVGVRRAAGDAVPVEPVLWLIDVAARAVRHVVGLPGNLGGNSQKVCISDDGRRVVVEYEGDVRVIDTRSGDELMRHKGRVNAGTLAVSRDGKLIAFGRYDLFLWRWDTGAEPKTFARIGSFGVQAAGFSPDGKTLLAVTDGRVAAFDVATGRQTGSFAPPGGTPWKWAFSPDGRTLAVTNFGSAGTKGDDAVVLVDPATWTEVGRFPVGRSRASHVGWSADGARLAAVTDYRVWAWDVKTRRSLGPGAPGHEGHVTGFAFGPDGRLYTAGDDHTVRSWNPATAAPGRVLPHDGWVRGVAVSPDGALVAGSALRNDLRVWDAATGAERFRLLGNGEMGGRREVRFTPDGKRLVAWGDDLYLRVWDARNGKLLAEHRTLPDGVTEAQLDDERQQHLMIGFAPGALSADGSALAFGR